MSTQKERLVPVSLLLFVNWSCGNLRYIYGSMMSELVVLGFHQIAADTKKNSPLFSLEYGR